MADYIGQYFDEDPNVESKPVSFEKNICGINFEFKSDRGVFSRGSLDKATEVLLKEFNDNYIGNPNSIADVGCGYGPIIIFLAKKYIDAQLLGIEPNLRAQTLCDFNYKKNVDDSRLSIIVPSELEQKSKFDLIISNPPIRIGKKALYDLLKIWSNRLTSDGQMWIVMAKHLGADSCVRFLESQCGLDVTRVASKKGIRILKCIPSV